MSTIGDRVRQARKAAGHSQEQLAERVKVNRSYLSLIENGKSSPTFDFLEKIADGLGMRLEDLVLGQSVTGLVAMNLSDGPMYEGLAELLQDEAQMLLMNPTPDELAILRTIRMDLRYRPSKRFFIEALLDLRKNRLSR